jgi:hypothetical protein
MSTTLQTNISQDLLHALRGMAARAVEDMPSGSQFESPVLLSSFWDILTKLNSPQSIGRALKYLVDENEFPSVSFIGVQSNRHNLYQKN